MFKKGVCLFICLVLGISMVSPAFVHAYANPQIDPSSIPVEAWESMQYLGISLLAGGEVSIGSQGMTPLEVCDNVVVPQSYSSRQKNNYQKIREQLGQAILDGEITQLPVGCGFDDLNALVAGDWQNYYHLGTSVSANSIPDYVPDEFKAQLSYLNTIDDLNLYGCIPADPNYVFVSANLPDYNKLTLTAPGGYYSWYYNVGRTERHGLFYYLNDIEDADFYLNGWSSAQHWAYGEVLTFYDSLARSYLEFNITPERYKILIPNDHTWGEYEESYGFHVTPYNGYNDDYNFVPDNFSTSLGPQNYVWHDTADYLEYQGSQNIRTGDFYSYNLAICNGDIVNKFLAGDGGQSLSYYTAYVQHRTDDKLLDTITALSETMRNVDVYVGSDWSDCQLWYKAPDEPEFAITFPDVPTVPGTTDPVTSIAIPRAGFMDLVKFYQWLLSLADGQGLLRNLTLDLSDVPGDVFPDPDNNNDPSPIDHYTPQQLSNPSNNPNPQPDPEPNPDLYPDPDPASNTLDPGAILPMSLPVNKFSGLLWSRPLYNSEYMTGEAIPSDAPSTSSPVHAAVELFQALDATCNGFLSTYLVVTITAFIVMAFVIKLLHG